MKYLALALLAAMTLAGGAFAQDTRPLIRYSLDNGLDVILAPDGRVPKVVLDIGYKVGANNEPPGRAGFAHLFEHLMFSGTPAYPNIDVAYGTIGGDINAFTGDDQTAYHEQALSSALPMMLAIEADRMANGGAAITGENLDIQRDVVLNEIRENVLDSLNGAAYQVARATVFPKGHPYSRSVYGSIADLEAATIEDVRQFFDTYYVPNNAILVLVGDFDIDATKAMIADTFGRIQRGADVPRNAYVPVAPQRARVELTDVLPTPTLILTWAVAPLGDPQVGTFDLLAELLGNSEYGVLKRTLIDTGVSNGAWSYVDKELLGTRFSVEVSVAEGVTVEAVEAATRAALSGFLAAPLGAADLAREKQKVTLYERVQNEAPLELAHDILLYADAIDDPARAVTDDPAIIAATPDSLMRAARKAIDPVDASVTIVRPGERGDYPALLTESSGEPAPLNAAKRAPIEMPKLLPGEPVAAPPARMQTATLSNGIRVIHYDMPRAPMAYIAAESSVSMLAAPAGKEGIVEIAAAMAVRGAGDLGPVAFGQAIKDLGGNFETPPQWYTTPITLSAPPQHLDAAIGLLGDVLQRPKFDAAEWDTNKVLTLDDLARRETDVSDVAGRYGLAALFPTQPGEAAIDRSITSVKSITRDEAAAIFPRIFSPQTVTFYSVGAVPLVEVVASLERTFGTWTSDAMPLPPARHRSAVFPDQQRVLLVPDPAASQSALYIATPAPGFDEAGSLAAVPVFRLLGEDFISRINAVIREDKGYTYGTDGKLLDFARTGSVMVIEAPVIREDTGAALSEIFKAFASLKSDPVRPDELERTVTTSYADLAGIAETAGGLFEDVYLNNGLGSSLAEDYERRVAVTKLDLDTVRKQASAMSSLDHALIVVVGDPKTVKPQLEALGLTVELVERNL